MQQGDNLVTLDAAGDGRCDCVTDVETGEGWREQMPFSGASRFEKGRRFCSCRKSVFRLREIESDQTERCTAFGVLSQWNCERGGDASPEVVKPRDNESALETPGPGHRGQHGNFEQ